MRMGNPTIIAVTPTGPPNSYLASDSCLETDSRLVLVQLLVHLLAVLCRNSIDFEQRG